MINPMSEPVRDRILIVESDPLVADLISRQALQAAGFQTQVVNDATTAISRAIQANPDVLIANLNLPGLSGKDLMVALKSQGLDIPVIVLARKGQEADIIQAFRLGAVDTMIWPLQEPEIINVVERVLKSVRERKERDRLAQQLQHTNQELQLRVRELTTIFALGKAVTSITDQTLLFERILEGGARVSQADMGWILQRPQEDQPFYLVAQRGLPPSLAGLTQQPWDDGISSLVALSGEPLSLNGEPVRRLKISGLGQSALIVPIKVRRTVIGLIVMMRKQPTPFTPSEQHLLEAVADYASISLANVRLFRTIEERARSQETLASGAQLAEKIDREILQNVKDELANPLQTALAAFAKLAKDPNVGWTPDQRQTMSVLQDQLQILSRVSVAIQVEEPELKLSAGGTSLSGLLQAMAGRFQPLASQMSLALRYEAPAEDIEIQANSNQVSQVIAGLLSYALKSSNPGGQIALNLVKSSGQAQISVSSSGPGLNACQMANLFEPDDPSNHSTQTPHFGGLGISLVLAKEIVVFLKGKIWAESRPGYGTRIYFSFPIHL